MNKKAWSLLPFTLFFLLLGCSPTGTTPTGETGILFIKKKPNQTTFNVGQAFDLSGLNVIDLKTSQSITSYVSSIEEGYVFTASDTGNKTVDISKEGYTPASFDIKVTNYKMMEIVTLPKTEFGLGDNFVTTGLVVRDVNTEAILDGLSFSIAVGSVLEQEGTFDVTIGKTGYLSISYQINVSDYPFLEISKLPSKSEYSLGDIFSLAGMQITCNGEIIEDYTVSGRYQEGDEITQSGDFNFIVSKENHHSTSFYITVYKYSTMVVTTPPNKVDYVVGEEFDSTGLVIKDKNNELVTGYTLSIVDGEKIKTKGKRDVIVSKEGYRDTSFEINVTEGGGEYTTNVDLNIYYMNDTHGSFARMSSFNEAGMSGISSYIKYKKSNDASNGNYSLVLSGGDMFQGGLESNETRGAIMIDAMNEIGFDAMVLGNHEFDWGEDYISEFAEGLNCPILACNVFYSSDKKTRPDYVTTHTIIEKDNLRIGIIGAVEQGMNSSITGSVSDNFYFPSPVAYIKDISDMLRLSYNCDIILGGFHDGGTDVDATPKETVPSKFSSLVETNSKTGRKYVDAMFFAHDHYTKTGEYNGVPFLESGSNAKYVGIMSLNLKSNGTSFLVNDYDVRNIYAYSNCTTSDPAIDALFDKYAEEIGNPEEVIYTFNYSYSRNDFIAIAVEAMLWYVNERYPAVFGNTHVYFASHNYQGARVSTIPSGPMDRRFFCKAFPFDNNLCIQTCTSANIEKMKASKYYITRSEYPIIYDDQNYTHAVTISYIAESSYARRDYQISYKTYRMTAKNAFELFLREKVRTDL